MKNWLCATTALLSLGVSTTAGADEDGLVWAIEGEQNTVYLVGSIHLLRQSDYPLPPSINTAYEDAERLYMELDMDDLDQMSMARIMMEAGRVPQGQSLTSLLGDDYEAASEKAALINLDLKRLDMLQPWLVAITVTQMAMMSEGFDPMAGVEMHITQMATADQKPIEGLETIDEQIGALSGMEMDDQVEFLLMTLEEMDKISEGVDLLVGAWRSGDIDTMVNDLIAPMNENEDVYDAMLTNRNSNWIQTIEAQLEGEDDVMILVGAAHLVGEDSVNAMLEKRGHKLRRITAAP
ncbi:MAG: TraB/GumN family protein [Pseudomonadota bacterium]